LINPLSPFQSDRTGSLLISKKKISFLEEELKIEHCCHPIACHPI
jgi:hypothetical protein